MTDTTEITPGNEVEIIADDRSVEHDIQTMKDGNIALVSSIDTEDFDGALAVADAIGNSIPLDNFLGQPFELRDYVVQKVSILDEKNGVFNDAARVTLITTDERYLHATSKGVFSSLRNLIGLIGTPDRWPDHKVKLQAVKEPTRNGYKTILLKPVRDVAKTK